MSSNSNSKKDSPREELNSNGDFNESEPELELIDDHLVDISNAIRLFSQEAFEMNNEVVTKERQDPNEGWEDFPSESTGLFHWTPGYSVDPQDANTAIEGDQIGLYNPREKNFYWGVKIPFYLTSLARTRVRVWFDFEWQVHAFTNLFPFILQKGQALHFECDILGFSGWFHGNADKFVDDFGNRTFSKQQFNAMKELITQLGITKERIKDIENWKKGRNGEAHPVDKDGHIII